MAGSRNLGIPEKELAELASELGNHADLDRLGRALGFKQVKVDMYLATNLVGGRVGCKGTSDMLFDWKRSTLSREQRAKLGRALIEAGFMQLAESFCGDSQDSHLSSLNYQSEDYMYIMDEFDEVITKIARDLHNNGDIQCLGAKLGVRTADVQRCLQTNMRYGDVSYQGTLKMLRDWRMTVSRDNVRRLLREALLNAKLNGLADDHLPEGQLAGPAPAAAAARPAMHAHPAMFAHPAMHAHPAMYAPPAMYDQPCDPAIHVTETEILFLANNLIGDAYSSLATVLGFSFATYDNIKRKNHFDMKEAYLEVLHGWRLQTGGLKSVMDKALKDAECGALIGRYKGR